MNDRQLAELLKYSNPKELYVVTRDSILKVLSCPFKVKVLGDVGILVEGEIVFVDQIKVTLTLKTVFIIERQAYYYHHFDIII